MIEALQIARTVLVLGVMCAAFWRMFHTESTKENSLLLVIIIMGALAL